MFVSFAVKKFYVLSRLITVLPQDIHALILGKAMTGLQAFAN